MNRPAVLLLDEPLGALDLKLREEMQVELKAIQQQVGITFVFVTHDQQEALSMSDRIAVFERGRIEQIGTPTEVYEHPATEFVADFVGTSNLLTGDAARGVLGAAGTFTVRPEKIRILAASASIAPTDEQSTRGTVRDVQYLGAHTRYRVTLDAGGELIVDTQNVASDRERRADVQAVSGLAARPRVRSATADAGRNEERRRTHEGHGHRMAVIASVLVLAVAACGGDDDDDDAGGGGEDAHGGGGALRDRRG